MADKSTVLCADHLCIHNSCGGYYGICVLSALSVGTYAGIDRIYMNTCPKKEHIPKCIARGPGKIAVFHHGAVGSNKSTIDLERTFEIMTSSAEESKTFTMDDVMADIRQFISIPKPGQEKED